MLIRMRRMMLIAASWPSNSAAAVTKRTLLVGRYSASALNSADRSVMGFSVARTLEASSHGIDVQRWQSACSFWALAHIEQHGQRNGFSAFRRGRRRAPGPAGARPRAAHRRDPG